jgi:carbon starvation protein
VTNSTVDGVLAALFAVLIIVVILDAARVWVQAIRAREPLAMAEAPFEESQIIAPAGLFWTPEERTLVSGDGEALGASSGSVRVGEGRFTRTAEEERVSR